MDGQTLRIPIPPLNEERRVELTKVAGKYAEAARVAVRNVRRDGMDALKKMEKDGDISEDEQRSLSDEVQKLTDSFVGKVDEALKNKEAEIMQVCPLRLQLPRLEMVAPPQKSFRITLPSSWMAMGAGLTAEGCRGLLGMNAV